MFFLFFRLFAKKPARNLGGKALYTLAETTESAVGDEAEGQSPSSTMPTIQPMAVQIPLRPPVSVCADC